jgi:hypothetical protein
MATWDEVRETLERYLGAERITDEVLRVGISLVDEQGSQGGAREATYAQREVYVRREVMPPKDGVTPGIEFVAIDGPIGRVGETDLMSAIAQAGQLVHGGLTYAQGTGSGTLSFGMRLPADLIDLGADSALFLGYLYHVGGAARDVTSELNSQSGLFATRTGQIRESAWGAIRQMLIADPTLDIEKDNNKALIFSMPGPIQGDRKLRMFTGLWEKNSSDHCVILEFLLGDFAGQDMKRAAAAAARTDGGVVYSDDLVSIRITLDLAAVTVMTFATRLVELAKAAEGYLDGIA